jgi:cell division protein FtsL
MFVDLILKEFLVILVFITSLLCAVTYVVTSTSNDTKFKPLYEKLSTQFVELQNSANKFDFIHEKDGKYYRCSEIKQMKSESEK